MQLIVRQTRTPSLCFAQHVLCGALAFAAPVLHATNYTWLGLGVDNAWTDSGNWSPGTSNYPFPGASHNFSDDALLPASSQEYEIALSTEIYVNSLTVNAPYVLDVNGILTLQQGVIGSGLALNVQENVTFTGSANAGSTAINVASNGALDFTNNATAGTAAIADSGRVLFFDNSTGTNASVTLTGGTLDVSGMSAPLTLNSLNDTLASPGSLALGTTSLTLQSTANQNFYGSVSGTGMLTQAGTGVLTLSGSNSAFAGGLSAQAGTLQVDGDFSTASVTVNGGATLRGGGHTGAMSLVNGTLVPGGGTGATLRVTALACSSAPITFNLDTGTRLVVDQALTVAQCPQWHVTLEATQPMASGQSFDVATLSSGTDYVLANIAVTPPTGYTARAGRRGNDILMTVYNPADEIFGNGFD